MRGLCESCGGLLFSQYGDGDRECATCRETREEQADVIARDRAVLVGYRRDVCLAHAEPEPCSTCAASIAAGL